MGNKNKSIHSQNYEIETLLNEFLSYLSPIINIYFHLDKDRFFFIIIIFYPYLD